MQNDINELPTVHQAVRTFPRKVVISPTFGAGICTWAGLKPDSRNYDLVEDPTFVEYIEQTYRRDSDELSDLLVATGRWTAEDMAEVYWGGLRDAVVVTVDGPYIIDEYDGSESIQTSASTGWRL